MDEEPSEEVVESGPAEEETPETAPELDEDDDDDDAAAEPEPEPEPDETEESESEPAEAADADQDEEVTGTFEGGPPPEDLTGWVTVDDVTYDIWEIRHCELEEDPLIDQELFVQGHGFDDDDEIYYLHVYIQSLSGTPFNDVEWFGPEGIMGADGHATVELNADGTVVSGEALIYVNHLQQDGGVDLEFEMEVPEASIPCI